MDDEDIVTRMLSQMRLEEAVEELRLRPGALDRMAVETMAHGLELQAQHRHARNEPGEAKRTASRARALLGLLAHGPNPGRMVAEVELPEGYQGKIVLVLFKGGGFEGTVCLRSGDGWHREILNNARAELQDLGFHSAEAFPLGGAYAGFDDDGRIVIWGTSDEFGACDKDLAAEMIRRAYPGRKVVIED